MCARGLFFTPWAGGLPADNRCAESRRIELKGDDTLRTRQDKIRSGLKMLWAAPWSLLGLLLGTLALLCGGHVQRKHRVLEFWGGCLPTILRVFPFYFGAPVATFGHIVLGRSDRHLKACRRHQFVHIRQYERWGILFVPAYLTCSAAMWLAGKRPYYDNPFERSAFSRSA